MELQSRVEEWAHLWRVPSLARVEITVNSRLRTCLGRCLPKSNRIELNPSLLRRRRSKLTEILCHEAAHIAAYLLGHDRERPHSGHWASLMMAAGFKPQARVTRRGCIARLRPHEVRNQVFEHYCPVCRFMRIARKRVPRWKCRVCVSAGLRGNLKIRTRRAGARNAR